MSNISEKIVKTITNILTCIVIVAIFFALYNFIQLNIKKNQYVSFFGYTVFDVATGSMSGAIEINDIIVVKITDDYEVGDIITYHSGNDFITHRLIEKVGDVLVTKGDSNNTADNPIDKDLVLGKVVKVLPQFGVWRKVLLTPKVLISVFITLMLFSFAFSYKPKKKNKVKVSKSNDKQEKLIKNPLKVEEVLVSENTEVLDLSSLKLKKSKASENTEVLDLSSLKDLDKTEVLDFSKIIDKKNDHI